MAGCDAPSPTGDAGDALAVGSALSDLDDTSPLGCSADEGLRLLLASSGCAVEVSDRLTTGAVVSATAAGDVVSATTVGTEDTSTDELEEASTDLTLGSTVVASVADGAAASVLAAALEDELALVTDSTGWVFEGDSDVEAGVDWASGSLGAGVDTVVGASVCTLASVCSVGAEVDASLAADVVLTDSENALDGVASIGATELVAWLSAAPAG